MLFCDTPAHLKANMPGAVLSVVTANPRGIGELLSGNDGISNMMVVGDGLHLVVKDATRMVPELKSIINSANLSFDSIEQVTPTVEDLFVEAVKGDTKGREK
jgi:ABC-2 type transport system ATP-binding protein